jgi:hypothetical protein
MPQIAADLPSPSCYRLFSGPGIQEFQRVGPDLLCFARATHASVSPKVLPATRRGRRHRSPRAGLALQPKEESRCRFAADCTSWILYGSIGCGPTAVDLASASLSAGRALAIIGADEFRLLDHVAGRARARRCIIGRERCNVGALPEAQLRDTGLVYVPI